MPKAAYIFLARPAAALVAIVSLSLAASAQSLNSSNTSPLAIEDTGSSPPSASLTPSSGALTASSAETSSRRIILLVGDQPTRVPTGGSAQLVDLKTTAALLLDARIIDQTTAGMTLAEVQKQTREILALQPTVVVLFAGPADAAAKTSEEQRTYALHSFARMVTNAGISLFVLPASTDLDALTVAELRILVTSAGERVTFVDLGGELGGRPFQEALEEVRRSLDAQPAGTQPTPAQILPQRTPEVTLPLNGPDVEKTESLKEDEPAKLPPAMAGTPKPKREPHQSPDLYQSKAPSGSSLDSEEPTSAVLRMRPPVPVKQFSPRRPAPNKPTEKKKPSFDR